MCEKHPRIFIKDSLGIILFQEPYCKILNTHFSKRYCKDSSYTVNIIAKLKGTGCTDRNTMDFAA